MNKNLLASLVAATVISSPIYAQTVEMSASELAKLQQQISELQSKLTELQQQVEAATAGVASNSEAIGEEAGDVDEPC